jgi:hypothetical protein
MVLSARDVEEALKERLLRSAYPAGGALSTQRPGQAPVEQQPAVQHH